MKKLLLFALIALLTLGSCGCMKKPDTPAPVPQQSEPTPAPEPAEWPAEIDSLPAFTDVVRYDYAGKTASGWEISLCCTLEQLEDWRNQVEQTGQVYGDFSVFHNGEYVVQIHESRTQGEDPDQLDVVLYLTETAEMVWPEEMKAIPAYAGSGAVTSSLTVDSAYIENWLILEATLYGETPQSLQTYLDLLTQEGFEEKDDEDGGRYLRLRGDLADQMAYEFEGDSIVTLTWAICPAQDLAEE